MGFNELVATICRTRTIAAEPQAVWNVLADFGEISSWVATVDHSCLLEHNLSPDLIGTSRRIQIGRATLVERITECTPGQSLGYDVEGLPRRLRRVHAHWQLIPAGATASRVETRIILSSTVEIGTNPIQQIAAHALCRAMAHKSDGILAGLARRMERTGG